MAKQFQVEKKIEVDYLDSSITATPYKEAEMASGGTQINLTELDNTSSDKSKSLPRSVTQKDEYLGLKNTKKTILLLDSKDRKGSSFTSYSLETSKVETSSLNTSKLEGSSLGARNLQNCIKKQATLKA